MQSDLATVQRLATENPLLLKETDRNGLFPIHAALASGNASIVDFLVDMERENLIHYIAPDHKGLVRHAASTRYTKLVIRLIEEFGLEITHIGEASSSSRLLHIATMTGNLSLVKYLVDEMPELGGRTRPKLTDLNPRKESLLFSAISRDRLEVFLYLVEQCPSLLDTVSDHGLPPFWSAVRWGATRIVSHMIETKMNRGYPESWERPDSNTEQRQSHKDHFEIVIQAAYYGCLDLIQWLNSHGYDLETPRNATDESALHAAAEFGNLEVVKYLLAETALDPSDLDADGLTPLAWACSKGHLDVVQFLQGIRPESERLDPVERQLSGPKSDRLPLLRYAAQSGKLALCQWLVTSGISDINYQDSEGYTALMEAAQAGKKNIVEWLLTEGADPKIRNSDPTCNFTAFWHALDYGHLDILKLLHEHDSSVIWDQIDILSDDSPLTFALERRHFDICIG
jgi:ankyrin repeat protein